MKKTFLEIFIRENKLAGKFYLKKTAGELASEKEIW